MIPEVFNATDVLSPENQDAFWSCIAGLSIGSLVTIMVMMRHRRSCALCGKYHPPRPANMTAVEYIQFFCDGQRRGYTRVNTDTRRFGKISVFRKKFIKEDDDMQEIELFTSAGDYVVTAIVPPFMKQPEALAWGSRTFIFNLNTQRYEEGCVFYVQEHRTKPPHLRPIP